MEKIQSQVKKFMQAARQECPLTPVIPEDKVRILRARLIMEEALETISALGVSVICNEPRELEMESLLFEVSYQADLVELADGLADLHFVSYGTALACGIDMESIEDAVYENNMSKFQDSWFDDTGKLRKGPSYKPVDLKPILEKQYE